MCKKASPFAAPIAIFSLVSHDNASAPSFNIVERFFYNVSIYKLNQVKRIKFEQYCKGLTSEKMTF